MGGLGGPHASNRDQHHTILVSPVKRERTTFWKCVDWIDVFRHIFWLTVGGLCEMGKYISLMMQPLKSVEGTGLMQGDPTI